MTGRLLVIIPCYNEACSLGGLLDEIAALGAAKDVLVVDDGSTDGSADIARRHGARCVSLVYNLGIGGAVQTGIKYALRNGYDWCVQLDGDGQHDPRDLPRLLEALEAGKASIAVGTRYLQAGGCQSTAARRFGSRLISLAIRFVHGVALSDPTSGMRLLDRRAMACFAQDYPHDFPEPITVARALAQGLTVVEIPVEMRPRRFGASSIGGLKSAAYMFRVLCYIVLTRFGPGRKENGG